MDKKKSYEEKLQAELDEWSAKIDVLKAKAAKAKSEAKVSYAEEIEDLEKRKAAAKKKLQEFKSSGDEAWEDLKSGLNKAWKELGEAVNSAADRFK